MSKALVIKGSDFTANKVTTVSFIADVPCEGITFSQNTYTLTNADPVTVVYTLTPANTTDTVSWTSSNTNIVTISGGVMTIVGIGSCTVTATCGEQTATATVSVSMAYTPNWVFGLVSHTSGKSYIGVNLTATSRITAIGSGALTADYKLIDSTDVYPAPILIPGNTGSVRITYDTTYSTSLYNADYSAYWGKNESCGDSNYPQGALYVSYETFALRASGTATLTVPSGVDIISPSIRLSSSYSGELTATELANSYGFTIEFIAAE